MTYNPRSNDGCYIMLFVMFGLLLFAFGVLMIAGAGMLAHVISVMIAKLAS